MSRKIKVLFTISNFNTAGSGKVVYDLVNGLDKSKFDIEIACEDSNGAFFKTMESLGLPIRIFRTKTHYRPYHTLLFRIWNISKFYKKHQYDLIHSWQWSNDWTEAMAARLIGIKWIYTKKAMGFRSKHWKIKSWLAHFIVTINDEMRDYFPNKKAQALIPLGIDTEYYCSDTFKKNKTTNTSKFNIITVANLVPVKGIEVLLQAVKELNNASLHVTILGANDNDYGQEMMALSKALGIDNQVDFIGKQLDVRPYIAKSDLSGFNIDVKGGAVLKLSNSVLFELTMPLIQFIKVSETSGNIKYTETAFVTALNNNEFSPYEIGISFMF